MRKIITYNPKLKDLAQKLRNDSTKSEIALWSELRDKSFLGQKFIRQKPLDEFIVDFYCYELELVIEIDGITHQFEDVQINDKLKENKLKNLGLEIIRFEDAEVLNDMDNVLRVLEKFIIEKNNDLNRTTHPLPLSRGESAISAKVDNLDHSSNSVISESSIHYILKKFWGFDSFRPLQEDIINEVLAKKDALALLPTGGGKSICFQVPALALDGVCVVVSPLVALMKDQVQNLKSRGIKATALFSGMRKEQIDIALDNCIYGDTKFLYLSPERLSSDLFIARFKKMKVSFITVDEAHCISQWGYDFRPAYLKISSLREIKPELSVLALTATATPDVVSDIQEKLEFKKENVLQKSFLRNNLSYSVLYEQAKLTKLIDILEKVKGSAIVYVQNRRQTKEIAEYIYNHKISSTYYHAGLNHDVRDERQKQWLNGKTRVIVATNAFGMGIDKPNVRVVVHMTLPDSLEAYFQEAGRAGRDGKKAYAVLLTNETDKLKTEKVLSQTMPNIEEIRSVYDALGNFFQLAIGSGKDHAFSFDISDFCGRNKFGILKTYNALKFLEYDEYLTLSENVNQSSKVLIKCSRRVFEEFMERQKEYKNLLKLMLRSYGGMFDNFTNIKEKFLCTKLNISLEVLNKKLKYLETQNIIIYEAQYNNPFLFFNESRLEVKDLKLNVNNIKQRIKIFEVKHQEMLHYSQTKTICRSQMLLKYFGEEKAEKCGVCDVCLGRNSLDISDEDLEKFSNKIAKALKKNPMSLEDLIKGLKVKNTDKFHLIVKYLMNTDFIQRKADGNLLWIKKNKKCKFDL